MVRGGVRCLLRHAPALADDLSFDQHRARQIPLPPEPSTRFSTSLPAPPPVGKLLGLVGALERVVGAGNCRRGAVSVLGFKYRSPFRLHGQCRGAQSGSPQAETPGEWGRRRRGRRRGGGRGVGAAPMGTLHSTAARRAAVLSPMAFWGVGDFGGRGFWGGVNAGSVVGKWVEAAFGGRSTRPPPPPKQRTQPHPVWAASKSNSPSAVELRLAKSNRIQTAAPSLKLPTPRPRACRRAAQ